MISKVFIPHRSCSDASGGCFVAGRCLMKCQTRLPANKANAALTEAIELLKQLRDYIVTSRGVTKYVDGSSIDVAVKKADQLILRCKP